MNVGTWELFLVVVVLLVLYGRRLPDVTRALGRGLSEIKRNLRGIKDDITQIETESLSAKKKPDEPGDKFGDDKKTGEKKIPDLPYSDKQDLSG